MWLFHKLRLYYGETFQEKLDILQQSRKERSQNHKGIDHILNNYTILDLSHFICKRCETRVYHEKHNVSSNEYPFYCEFCDENMFSFEVEKKN